MLSECFTAAAEELFESIYGEQKDEERENELANLTTVQEGYKNNMLYT